MSEAVIVLRRFCNGFHNIHENHDSMTSVHDVTRSVGSTHTPYSAEDHDNLGG